MNISYIQLGMNRKVSMEGQTERVLQRGDNEWHYKTGHTDQKSLRRENIYENNKTMDK